jgi:glycosyltransferase involved in cell wall biosynthesis
MKILELNFEKGWRGGERQTIYNIAGFKEAEQAVVLLCRKGCPLEKKAQELGFEVFSFGSVFGIIRFLIANGKNFDVIHAQTSHILTYCLATKPFHRKKVIFSRRVDFVPKGKMTKLKYKLTDKLIAVSSVVRDIISVFSERDDVEVISDIAVPKVLDEARAFDELEKKGIKNNKHIIGTTAALVPHKDPLTMVEAIRQLASIRKDFVFLHFGYGELEDEVKHRIEQYNLQDHYKLMGFYENVENFFSAFKVFVIGSKEEGLGSSVLDAFLYHVPVVSTDAGGLKDIVNDKNAIVCRVGDYKMIAKGINNCLNEDTKTMTANAYAYVREKHNTSYITSQYLTVMKKIIHS